MNEHREALRNQARDMRLAAQQLEKFARSKDSDRDLMVPASMPLIFIQRKLGMIGHNLNALMARFGKADR